MSAWNRLAWVVAGVAVGALAGVIAAVGVFLLLGATGFFLNPDDAPLHRVWESVAILWGGLLIGAVLGGAFAWRRTLRGLELTTRRGSAVLFVLPATIAVVGVAWGLAIPEWKCVRGSDTIVCTDHSFARWLVAGVGVFIAVVVAFAVAVFRRRKPLRPAA